MIKKEFKAIIARELVPFFQEQGYKKISYLGMLIALYKEDSNTVYRMGTDDLKYNGFVLIYYYQFGLKIVNSILKEIEKHVPLKKGLYHPVDTYLLISPGVLLDPFHHSRAYDEVMNEQESVVMLDELKQFYLDQFIPFYDKYSDIHYMDSLINNLDDFWEGANGRDRYPGIGYFHIIRLIYARLANNPNFDTIVERNLDAFDKYWKSIGGTFDRNADKEFAEVYAGKYLRDLSDADIEKLRTNGI